MLVHWVKKNKKLALKITGVNFLLMALVMLFWAQPKNGMSENEKASANLARMEAQVSGSSQKPASSAQDFRQVHAAHQAEQVRIFLILMVILGSASLVYGFLKKEDTPPS